MLVNIGLRYPSLIQAIIERDETPATNRFAPRGEPVALRRSRDPMTTGAVRGVGRFRSGRSDNSEPGYETLTLNDR